MEDMLGKYEDKIERIKASAIRLGDEIYTGRTHTDAIIEMENDYPDWSDSNLNPEDGFMTSTGRFVERDEAGEIALKAEQLDHLASNARSQASEYLDSHNIEEFRPKWMK